MWKYEGQGLPQQTKLDKRISQLAKHLDFEFTSTQRPLNFPGYNLDIVQDKLISSINQKLGGLLCKPNEIVLIEQ
jgi:hypothetical protein